MAQRQIPPERRRIYYIGLGVTIVGFLSFLSVFITGALHFGDFSNFAERGRSEAQRAIIGMVMIIAGQYITRIGRMGLSGSGLKLDPEEARRDVEPWARMTGGVVKDALDEAGLKPGGSPAGPDLPFDEKLRRLQKLRDDGLIREDEYASTKKKILESA